MRFYVYVILIFQLYLLIKVTNQFISAISGCICLKKISQYPAEYIRLVNCFYSKKGYLRRICSTVFTLILDILFCYFIMMFVHSKDIVFIFLITIIITTLEMIRYTLEYLHGEECYLATNGIFTAMGAFKQGKFLFTVETEAFTNRIFINVYNGKSNVPFRFLIAEKANDAVEIISHF